MIELSENVGEQVSQCNKINDHPVSIRRADNIDTHRPVVAVDRFAYLVGERDEVASTKNMRGFAKPYVELFAHRFCSFGRQDLDQWD